MLDLYSNCLSPDYGDLSVVQNIQIIVLVTMEVNVFNLGQEFISFTKTSV